MYLFVTTEKKKKKKKRLTHNTTHTGDKIVNLSSLSPRKILPRWHLIILEKNRDKIYRGRREREKREREERERRERENHL